MGKYDTNKNPRIDTFGNKWWYNADGQFHRIGAPAVEYSDGSKLWRINGMRHRIDGPALEYINGYKEWWVNDKLHREDGPAIEKPNGSKEWWYKDKWIECDDQEEFERLIALELFW